MDGENNLPAGYYVLSAGSLSATSEVIGSGGSGLFTQSGGINTLVNNLYVGGGIVDNTQLLPGTGSYALTGGTLSAAYELIGDTGNGTVTQSGGSNTTNSLEIGIGTGPEGTATGAYNQSGGTNATSILDLGAAGGYGAYFLSNTGSLNVASFEAIQTGTFEQTGGINSITGNLYDGEVDGENNLPAGYYVLAAGSLSAASEVIGSGGSGSFTQSGGINTVGNIFYVGGGIVDDTELLPGTGSYALTGGTLSAAYELIGDTGNGIVTQSGGSNTTDWTLEIGLSGSGEYDQSGGINLVGEALELGDAGGAGIYNLSGSGVLNASSEIIGIDGAGTFIQTGGTNAVRIGLYVGGYLPGENLTPIPGSYSLSGSGTISTFEELVGVGGMGMFTQSGGANTIGDTLSVGGGPDDVGDIVSGTGSFVLSGGTLTSVYERIGYDGSGTFTQTGGVNSTTNSLQIGVSDGQLGPVAATYNQSGGSNIVGGLYLGNANAAGSYSLSGGSSLIAAAEFIGYSGMGTFTQTGGSNLVSGTLSLGYDDSAGTYQLQGGTLNAAYEALNPVGYGGSTAAFAQTGGTNTVTQQLSVLGAGSTYTLQPAIGTPVLNAATEIIGSGGSFNQYGGTNAVSGLLQVGDGLAISTYSLNGGSLTAQEELVGYGGTYDNFGQGSGTNTIGSGGSLIIEAGDYELNGGVLNAPNAVGGFITQSQGAFDLEGGTENGYLQNYGEFAYVNGTFNGFLENDGQVLLHASFVAGSGILNNATISVPSGLSLYGGGTGLDNEGELDIANSTIGGTSLLNDGLISGYGTIDGVNFSNYGLLTQGAGNLTLSATGANQNFSTITLASGRQLRLTGTTLVNEGGLALNSGIVTGVAELDNSVGGLITGPGSILGPFSNDSGGTVQIAAGTVSISQSFTNSGLISLTGVTANLTGPAVTNNGTIQGMGSVGSTSVTNAGIIEAIGGTLDFTGALANLSGGQILAGSGDKVLVTKGLTSNAGLINLTGGTFDNNSHALTNTGQISGYGTFRTGGLTNAATATFTGGQTTVNGNVTNAGGATITVAQTPAIFTGNVTNSAGATFKTISTTVTFSGTFTNNGSYISDPSTQNYNNIVEGAAGSISGGAGDVFNVSGNILNTSTENTLFDMSQSQLTLQGSVNHTFEWPGADLRASVAGYTNNFSIGIFELQAGGSLTLSGTGTAGAGIYVGVLDLDSVRADATQSAQLAALDDISDTITGNGSNIYYDPSLPGNSYLDGGTYALAGGGDIAPTPEPGTWAMFAMGAGAGLLEIRRRRVSKRQ